MKLFFLLIILSCPFFCSQSIAQQKILKKNYYRAWIWTVEKDSVIKGYYYNDADTLIVLNKSKKPEQYQLVNYSIHDIQTLALRKKGNIGKGFVIGSIVGAIWGLFYSCKTYNPSLDWSKTEDKIFCGFKYGIIGGAIGGIIASYKVVIPINGSKDNYLSHRRWLKRYSMENAR